MSILSAASASALIAIRPYVTGCLSSCFSSLVLHPIDLCKVRIQVAHTVNSNGGNVPTGLIGIIKYIWENEGISGFYKGLTASVARQAVYGTARLGLHEQFSELLFILNDAVKLSVWLSALSSMTAGAIAGLLGNPFDVALIRLSADGSLPEGSKRGYSGVCNAVYRISKEEGFMTLFRGSWPVVVRAIFLNLGLLATNDQLTDFFGKYWGKGSMSTLLSAAFLSGLVSAFTSLPFDLIKTRLQNMQEGLLGKMPYEGIMDCAVKIYQQEGFLRFWKGYWTYAARQGPHAMICLVMKEVFKKGYNKIFGLN